MSAAPSRQVTRSETPVTDTAPPTTAPAVESDRPLSQPATAPPSHRQRRSRGLLAGVALLVAALGTFGLAQTVRLADSTRDLRDLRGEFERIEVELAAAVSVNEQLEAYAGQAAMEIEALSAQVAARGADRSSPDGTTTSNSDWGALELMPESELRSHRDEIEDMYDTLSSAETPADIDAALHSFDRAFDKLVAQNVSAHRAGCKVAIANGYAAWRVLASDLLYDLEAGEGPTRASSELADIGDSFEQLTNGECGWSSEDQT